MAALAIVVALLILTCLILVIVRVATVPHRDAEADGMEPEWLSAQDRIELDQAFARAETEIGHSAPEVLLSRLQPVIRRRAPLRCVRRAPSAGTTRLSFADGTTILVRSQGGALARLALVANQTPVLLTACEPERSSARLTFEYAGTKILAVAVAVDQAD